MDRRSVLKSALTAGALALAPSYNLFGRPSVTWRRPRPGQAGWPSQREWARLNAEVGGRLIRPISPLQQCAAGADQTQCDALLRQLTNPYLVRDDPGLTQSLGWIDAWTSRPSAYAVGAESPEDVAAAVRFARQHKLRLVVKGGGHSYQGTSNAPDSLLVWTRKLTDIHFTRSSYRLLHHSKGRRDPWRRRIWQEAYSAVTTKAGGYVQGGGCSTVGVAGLVFEWRFRHFLEGIWHCAQRVSSKRRWSRPTATFGPSIDAANRTCSGRSRAAAAAASE